MTKRERNPNRQRARTIAFWLRSPAVLLGFVLAASGWAAEEQKPAAPQPIAIRDIKRRSSIDFESEVLPVLKANCLACHNQTSSKGDLVLETPQTIRKGGESGPAVVPGKPNESLLLQLASHQKRPLMPPRENKVAASDLKPEELGLIKLWIEQGAKGEVRASIPVQWRPLPKAIHPIYATALTRDGQFAACGRGNQIFVYHIPSGQLVAKLADPKLAKSGEFAHLDLVQSLDFSPDGSLLASAAFREVKLWRRSSESKVVRLPNPSSNAASDLAADGKSMAVISGTNQISIRDPRTGAERQKLTLEGGPITRIALSPDARLIASLSSNGVLEVWKIKDSKLLARTNLESGELIAWLSAQEFATASDTNIHLWELTAAVPQPLTLRKTLSSDSAIKAIAGSQTNLISADIDGTIRLWDLKEGKTIHTLNHGTNVTAIALARNGQRFASAGADRTIRLWSDDGKEVARLKGDRYLIEAMEAAERRATLASNEVSFRKTALKTAETQRTNELARLTKGTETNGIIQKVFTEKEQKLASAKKAKSAAETLVLELQSRLAAATTNALTNSNVSAAVPITNAMAATNQVLLTNSVATVTNELNAKIKEALAKLTTASNELAAAQKEFKKVEVTRSVILHELELTTNSLNKAVKALSEAKTVLEQSEASEKKARGKVETARERAKAGEQICRLLAFSPDNQVLVGVDDSGLHTWSAQTGAAFDVYRVTNAVQTIAFGSGHSLLAAASESIAQWNTRPSWRLERTIGGDKIESPFVDRVNAVRFSPDGKLLATGGGEPSRSGEIKIWNIADGKLHRDLPSIHSDTVLSLDFSPDGSLLASGAADKFLRVSSIESGKLLKSFEGHTHHVLGVGWKQDGRTLTSAGADTLVKVWNFVTGERLKNVEGFGKEVTSVAFVGVTGQFLAACGDGQLRLVRENAENVRGYTGATDFLHCAAATHDGKTVLAGGEDGILRVWSGDGKPLVTFAP